MPDQIGFAAYPSVFVYEKPGGKKLKHLIWGDYVKLLGPVQNGWLPARARGKTGWMKEGDLQDQRLLEVNFVNIGQGDGCLIVTPDDKFLLIDAGESDNMYRFLSWRFNLRNENVPRVEFDAAIITHPDLDHYKGFTPLFQNEKFHFRAVYHNGIVERDGGQTTLGPKETIGGTEYLTDVIPDLAALGAILDDRARTGKKLYPNMLKTARDSGRVGDIRALSTASQFVPGYAGPQGLALRVLGPATESAGGGTGLLRWFGDPGKTKNGHSVVIRAEYGQVRILLGGDLNVPSEEYLLAHHTGLSGDDPEALVTAARRTFEADVAKACHHGSADFTTRYLRAVNAIATVISSGDDEPYCHPRPDALGTLGKWGRGERPLIFSTELARSARDTIRNPDLLRAKYRELLGKRDEEANPEKRAKLDENISALLDTLERSISVYGMINVRTDGTKVLIGQRLEAKRQDTEWDLHCLEPVDGALQYISTH